MKAIVIKEYGDADQLVINEIEKPIPAKSEVLIQVKAFGINRSETYMRSGKWGDVAQVTGIECVGVVAEDTSGRFKKGQTVATIMGGMGRVRNGSYAEYTCVSSSNVFPLETTLDWPALAALPESYATAWACLHENMKIKSGDSIFVRGGTSALALAAINIASNIDGVTVYSSTRHQENSAILKDAGSAQVFVEADDLSQQVRKLHADGMSSVLDIIGNTTILDSLKMVKKGGYACYVGMLGGGPPLSFNPPANMPSSVNLNFFGSFMFGTKAFPLSDIPMQSIVDNVANGAYNAKPAKILNFADISEAHKLMENNIAKGKIVVVL